MATIMYPSLQKSQSMRSKRKSAVEMLAESKAYYVKSELVRDSHQVLPIRLSSGSCVHSTATLRPRHQNYIHPHQIPSNIPGWRPMSMAQYMAVSPSRSLPPLRMSGRRSTSACSDVLQNKLRKLLNSDSCENVSSSCSEERLLTDDFIPISPPAEYAVTERSSYRYDRDRSTYHRSPPPGSDQRVLTHKSLPDLHNNQRSHSQIASHGSNKSASNKSLSNRDSGESSGHYTHKSEPPPNSQQTQGLLQRPEVRRDSGSSTQHSGGSIYYEGASPMYPGRVTRQGYPQQPPDDRYRVPPYDYTPATVPFQDPTLSPGPGTFKRQKCFRYKQRSDRDRREDGSRPILRSKSDISDRYWRCGSAPIPQNRHSEVMTTQLPINPSVVIGTAVSHLEQFFEQLGLNSETYENIIMDGNRSSNSSSPVYFSDVSTVDSSRPIENNDYCQPPPPFRPSEPPSIVEKNARIIKWLCNCRKSQIINGNT